MDSQHPYALGHVFTDAGRQRLFNSGRYVRAVIADDRPLPDSFSLTQFRAFWHDQGPVGTCWANAGTQCAQILEAAAGNQPFQIARRFVAYYGKALEGGGNAADGGMASDALLAMTPEKGKGCCAESLWPYQANRQALAQTPNAAAIADAANRHIHQIADVQLGDEARRLIFNGHPVAIGIWWPYGWDTQGGTLFDSVGSGTYGHALVIVGWLTLSGKLYWQIDNSHGLIYRPLSPEQAQGVIGYKPISGDKTSDFYASDSALRTVIGYGNAELVSPATADGFVPNTRPMTLAEALV